MRGVVVLFCLIANAAKFPIDTHGEMVKRKGFAFNALLPQHDEDPRRALVLSVIEKLRTHAQDLKVQRVGLGTLGDLAVGNDNLARSERAASVKIKWKIKCS